MATEERPSPPTAEGGAAALISHTGSTEAAGRSRLLAVLDEWPVWVPVALAVLLTLVLRLPLLGTPGYPDEGGYLLVAQHWSSGGPQLYGDLFVDRPPLLLAIFRLAAVLGGLDALRLIGTALVVAMVVVAGWAGWLISGRRGSRWAAFTAAALASSPLLGAVEIDGELLAAPFILLSCALLLAAASRETARRSGTGYALLAGVAAMAAVLVKQNFVDAAVFAGVYLAAAVLTRRQSLAVAARLAAGFAAGVAIPTAAAAVWAVGWATGVSDLWFAVYGFRLRALSVLRSQDLIPADRLHTLELSAVKSGLVLLALIFVVTQFRALTRLDPLVLAVTVMLATEVVGVALGANYWPHYLIQLVPSLVLASASLAATSGVRLLAARIGFALVVVSAGVNVVDGAVPLPHQSAEMAAYENWIRAAAKPSDTLVVTYGWANVFLASGLSPTYTHLWSLPMRVLDPDLTQLSADLSGRTAPTWVVEWEPLDLLGDAPAATLRRALTIHYREVADICGHPIYLLDGADRQLPATVGPCG